MENASPSADQLPVSYWSVIGQLLVEAEMVLVMVTVMAAVVISRNLRLRRIR